MFKSMPSGETYNGDNRENLDVPSSSLLEHRSFVIFDHQMSIELF